MGTLRKLRSDKMVTRREVAIATGLTEGTIGNAEKAPEKVSSRTLHLLADYFNCSVDFILGRETVSK